MATGKVVADSRARHHGADVAALLDEAEREARRSSDST
jgi:hypothetical protein